VEADGTGGPGEFFPDPEDVRKLRGLRMADLKKRARELDVTTRELEDVEDAPDRKERIVQMIVGRARQVRSQAIKKI
jgi:hypothetical protein